MKTTFTNCVFVWVDFIPNINKGEVHDAIGGGYNDCTFLIERGKPAILYKR